MSNERANRDPGDNLQRVPSRIKDWELPAKTPWRDHGRQIDRPTGNPQVGAPDDTSSTGDDATGSGDDAA